MERGGEGAGTGGWGGTNSRNAGTPPPRILQCTVAVASSPHSNETHFKGNAPGIRQFSGGFRGIWVSPSRGIPCIFHFCGTRFRKILRNQPDFTWDDREHQIVAIRNPRFRIPGHQVPSTAGRWDSLSEPMCRTVPAVGAGHAYGRSPPPPQRRILL